MFAQLQARDCPVCGRPEREAEPFLAASVDPDRMGSFSFASRKAPEYMSFRLVRCRECETVFAAEAPAGDDLARAYEAADFDSAEEAVHAARTYAQALKPHLRVDDFDGPALEIGTGTGVFLRELQRLGFERTLGIEPSAAAIAAADPDLRDRIRPGVFRAADHARDSFSLMCCFMTLEHVPAPRELTADAFRLLRPGGQVAFVTHDYTARVNCLLGRRSPIIDVEHMQLFCPQSLRRLMGDSGFEAVHVAPIRNSYPLRYWLRLLPLPARLKASSLKLLQRLGIGQQLVTLNVGNLLTVARKPALAGPSHS